MFDPFELIFVNGVMSVSRFFFFLAYGCPVVPAPFVEKTVLAPLYCLCLRNYNLIFRHGTALLAAVTA